MNHANSIKKNTSGVKHTSAPNEFLTADVKVQQIYLKKLLFGFLCCVHGSLNQKSKGGAGFKSRLGLLQKNTHYSAFLTLFYLVERKWRHPRKIWQK